MQEDLLNFGSCNDEQLLKGFVEGCSGVAVIVKHCLVKTIDSNGAAVRTVEKGTLIMVWSCHNEVRFSTITEHNHQVEKDCLLCKLSDIALVPNSLWGSLFPVPPCARVDLVKDTALAEKLGAIGTGSVVDLYGPNNEPLGCAVVLCKSSKIGSRFGYVYGIKIMGDETRAIVSEIFPVAGLKHLPPKCDAVVTIQHLKPSGRHITETNSRSSGMLDFSEPHPRMPKSISHHSMKNNEDSHNRRQASRSLDFSPKLQQLPLNDDLPFLGQKTYNHDRTIDLPSPVSKLHQTSRSLDLTQNRRLTRERACTSLDSDYLKSSNVVEKSRIKEENDDKLVEGSLVELLWGDIPLYGVIRWIGRLRENPSTITAGIELEEELGSEDILDPAPYFNCPPNKAIFVPYSLCRKDGRFQEELRQQKAPVQNSFGLIDCPVVEGTIPPITVDLQTLCGKGRGIQGHHNSCYLDATLFSMFAFTSVFDSLIYRPRTQSDIPQYELVQTVLKEEIVNPLRKNLYVRADRVMKLRKLMDELSSVTGLTSEEKDPEEFLNSLLAQILKAEPLLQLSSGQDAFYYQLFLEKDESLIVPTVQQLLEQSFLASNIKLKKLPSCLIIQMPRFGKSYKMYQKIVPPTVIDVTDVIEDSPRQCGICGQLAELECRECYKERVDGGSFCRSCMETLHNHSDRSRHVPSPLSIPTEFRELQEHCAVPRLLMHLFAVVCIETSHYVAFLKTKCGWVFFDSMADRKGEQYGYNIPEIVDCKDLERWLSEEGIKLLENVHDDRKLPDLPKRLLCDAYMCMYQSSDASMYR